MRKMLAEQNWLEVAKRLISNVTEREIPGYAQQVAYNILFAIGPLLIFITAFSTFIVSQVNVDAENPIEPINEWMQQALPAEAAEFLQEPLENAMDTNPGFMISIGGLLALWGARGAVNAIMKGLNKAYGFEETRPFIKKTVVALGLTIGLALAILLTVVLVGLGTDLGEDIATAIGVGDAWATAWSWIRWPLVATVFVLIVAAFHRYAPNGRAPFRWYLPGAVFTLVGGLLAVIGLQIYFSVSGGYTDVYGTFGAVFAFVFWLFVMAMVILLGGVVNSSLEREQPSGQEEGPTTSKRPEADEDHEGSNQRAEQPAASTD